MTNKQHILIGFLSLIVISLLALFLFIVDNKQQKFKQKFICENNVLKYKERDYIRNIIINSSKQINCKIENNQIIILND